MVQHEIFSWVENTCMPIASLELILYCTKVEQYTFSINIFVVILFQFTIVVYR